MPLTCSRVTTLVNSTRSPILRSTSSKFNPPSTTTTTTTIRSMSLIAQTSAKGKGLLFSEQDKLPNLPVPPLEQTLTKYLKTTLPLHESKQSLSNTESAVKSALEGKDSQIFKELQKRLENRRNNEGRENWLSDWWNDTAYMAYRDPVVPYVSYFYAHKDDKKRRDPIQRSATQLKAMLAFRRLLESEQLAPEKTKAGPMCSASYPWMFNSCRIPEKPADSAIKYEAEQNNHLVVAHNGRFWEFNLVEEGQELSAEEIANQLQKIVSDPISSSPDPFPVGALTSVNRDQWTDSRQALLSVGGSGGEQNKKSLERIQSSVIVLCLDDMKSITQEEVAMNLWFGNGKNRFYDKQQLISMPGGKSGYMGEHSTMDGTPTLRMNDFVLASIEQNKVDLGSSNRSNLSKPVPLSFSLDKTLETKIGESIKDFDTLKSKHDISMLDFQGYGKGQIKKFKCSPDAWAQMAIQLAYFRMFGKPCATYESAQTRKFKLGRTETIRSASVDSKAFCEVMEDSNSTDEERFQKFTAATKAHLSYAAACADGQGVDRHLFGLKKLIKEGEPVPSLYQDEMYGKSSTWKLSTSQISSERFECWGFGEVTPTGFGIAYAIKEDSLTFTITSLKLDAPKLRHYINEALLDIREMHINLQKKDQKSKM